MSSHHRVYPALQSISCGMLIAVLCLSGCQKQPQRTPVSEVTTETATPTASSTPEIAKPAETPNPSLASKLGGVSRDLNAPLDIGKLPKSNKPTVLVYYVNEMAPDAAESQNLTGLISWLREVGHPEISPHGDSIEFDLKKFPRVVDADLKALRDEHAQANDKQPHVVIFTNRLAQQGKFQLLHRDQPGVIQERAFKLPSNRPGLYQPYPMYSQDTLARAMKATLGEFPAKDFDFVLITKSHGSGNIAIAPRYQFVAEHAKREAFLKQITTEYQTALAKKLEGAETLFSSPGKKLVDAQGHGLVTKSRLLFWETIGRVFVGSDGAGSFLTDRAGKPFTTAEGQKIVIQGDKLTIDGTTQNVLETGDKPVQMLAVLARGMGLLDSPDKDILPASMKPQFIPLVKSPATAQLSIAANKVTMPILENDKATTPILAGDKTTVPILQADKSTVPILAGDKATIPILAGDKSTVPILDGDKATTPILAIDKYLVPSLNQTGSGDSTLGSTGSGDSTLGVAGDGTLGVAGDGTLGVAGDGTMRAGGVSNDATLSSSGFLTKGLSYGINKKQLVNTLRQSAEKDGVRFSLIFMESCASELPTELVQRLKSAPLSELVGQIWSSDSRGLQYTTIDFGSVFKQLATTPSFVDALSAELQAKYEADKASRESNN